MLLVFCDSIGTPLCFSSAIFAKRNKFCDFLFASWDISSLKTELPGSLGAKSFLLELISI